MTEPSGVRVLVAEDDPALAELFARTLRLQGHEVTLRPDGEQAWQALQAEPYDVALLDIGMPQLDGLEVLRRVRGEASPPEVIIITGDATIERAIVALRLGAYDFLSKPCRLEEIELQVRRAFEKRRLARENVLLRTRLSMRDPANDIVTQYAPMRAVLATVERVATSGAPVLITGELGTGKALVARAIHAWSGRPAGALFEVNCVGTGEDSLDRELFGPDRRVGDAPTPEGLMELAGAGSIFFDEIGELHLRVQGRLLRTLESGSFHRRGGTQRVDVAVRVIASTSADLERAAEEKTFRRDLLYQINTISITLPPLRERTVDIPLLAAHFLKRFGGAAPPRIADDAMEAMLRYAWPGNVRELCNVIERAVLLNVEGVIHARHIPLGIKTRVTPAGSNKAWTELSLADAERRHIRAALEETGWHQSRAAARLGISVKTLYRKIREYGFQRPGAT